MKNKNATVPKNPGNAAKLATGNAPSCSGLDSAVAVVTAMPIATDAVPTAEITATPLISRNHDSAIMSGPTSVEHGRRRRRRPERAHPERGHHHLHRLRDED